MPLSQCPFHSPLLSAVTHSQPPVFPVLPGELLAANLVLILDGRGKDYWHVSPWEKGSFPLSRREVFSSQGGMSYHQGDVGSVYQHRNINITVVRCMWLCFCKSSPGLESTLYTSPNVDPVKIPLFKNSISLWVLLCVEDYTAVKMCLKSVFRIDYREFWTVSFLAFHLFYLTYTPN